MISILHSFFLNSILYNSKEHNEPFIHWELNEPLSNEAIKEIVNADIPNLQEHNLTYDGTRAIDGGAAVHFKNGDYHRSLQFYPDSYAYYVSCEKGQIIEKKMGVHSSCSEHEQHL